LTEGGQEAWDLIIRLRSRIWIKADLQIDNGLTQHEVVQLVENERCIIIETTIQGNVLQATEVYASGAATVISQTLVPGGRATANLNWEDWDELFDKFK
jgi:hypothetical protein